MIRFIKALLITINLIVISNCTEKKSYSGKIINIENLDYSNLTNKEQILDNLGQPNFIDPIENKYFYYSEQKIVKNFYNQKIVNRLMLVFKINNNGDIISFSKYGLDDENDISLIKTTTPNDLVERGLLEKIFGGIGKGSIPNTPNE